MLSFMAGDVPHEPLPEYATGDLPLVCLARLIRRLHDAAADWEVPEDAVFGSIPGKAPSALEPLFDVPELVSHQDYCPGNIVFRDGLPAALIDFDLARPTTRVADLVNAVHWWAPLLHPDDRAPSLVDADVPARVRLFADAYGMTPSHRAAFVDVALRRQLNATLTMRAAAAADPVFRRWWNDGLHERMPRAEQWLGDNADALAEALRTGE